MKPKTPMLSPSENSEAVPSQKPKSPPPEPMGRKAEGRRRGQWLDGSMIGMKFSELTVIGAATEKYRDSRCSLVPCRCSCGKKILVPSSRLASPRRKSCGCKQGEFLAASFRTHGRQPRDVFRIWTLMRNRCLNPNSATWSSYGGRGIKICERWSSFVAFRDDMGSRPSPLHSVERIDNDKGYYPENCRWATKKEQARNRRSSRLITAFGKTLTLAEWADTAPASYGAIKQRLNAGWPAEKALSTPTQQ